MREVFYCFATALALVWSAAGQTPQLACKDNAGNDGRLISHCEMKEQTWPAAKSAMKIHPGDNGAITVNGWGRPDVLVRARIRTAAPSEAEARGMASNIRIGTSAVSIEATGPANDRDHHWSVDYEIFAPRTSDLQATTQNGAIHLTDLHGAIRFTGENGGVHLTDMAGNVKGETTNGGITIDLAGARWEGQGLDVETTNGGIRILAASNYSAHFETSTVNGGVRVRLPSNLPVSSHGARSFDTGSGGATIRAVTTNGGISIQPR